MYDFLYCSSRHWRLTTPAWISSLDFSGLTSTANDLAAAVAPVIVSILGIVIGIKLLKKFGNKIG